ncbi:hypothetical protein E2542_SST31519 [Spatholobus suberectus]|nr:hypothetical protein E2542_SST31519 [Spatholobus suberectus]
MDYIRVTQRKLCSTQAKYGNLVSNPPFYEKVSNESKIIKIKTIKGKAEIASPPRSCRATAGPYSSFHLVPLSPVRVHFVFSAQASIVDCRDFDALPQIHQSPPCVSTANRQSPSHCHFLSRHHRNNTSQVPPHCALMVARDFCLLADVPATIAP